MCARRRETVAAERRGEGRRGVEEGEQMDEMKAEGQRGRKGVGRGVKMEK